MRRLNRDEIDEALIRQGIGVLAMVDNGQPYAIPIYCATSISLLPCIDRFEQH
jgi:nitroimidazol reductase NimA-like FMN-containing flavoprotein (pyridoxamine 5'-phosphate oxidase superfamily)